MKTSTVRFYERRGLLPQPARSSGGYRDYADADVALVRFLQRGQDLGFTLNELDELTAVSRGSAGAVPGGPMVLSGEIAARGAQKLAEIDARIGDLTRMREALAGLLLAQCVEPDVPCPIVGALATDPGASRVTRRQSSGSSRRASQVANRSTATSNSG